MDRVHCVEAYKDLRVEIINCSAIKTNQQWLLEPIRHSMDTTEDVVGPLLDQHHQFIEDKTMERENAMQQ